MARASCGLRERLEPYQRSSWRKSTWQLANTLPPLVACCAGAHLLLGTSPVAAFALSILATGFLVRVYIIQHDCGHGSFFPSARANDWLGCALGVLTLLPYFRWRHDHARHHATGGDLGRRGTGDVWTLTLREYLQASAIERLRYRLYRHPLVLFGLGPLALFVVLQRLTYWTDTRREARSVHATNVAIACALAIGARLLGWRQLLAVEGVVTWMGATVAVWLFYVQHQFRETYWETRPTWTFEAGALRGASHYRLPTLLQFFTGSIGLHHVHHLCPRIPNYELQRCVDDTPELQGGTVVTLGCGFRCASLRVWDEEQKKLLSWRDVAARHFPRAARLL